MVWGIKESLVECATVWVKSVVILISKLIEIKENIHKSYDKTKYIGDEDPYYNTKISIFSFTWAGLAAFFSSDKI